MTVVAWPAQAWLTAGRISPAPVAVSWPARDAHRPVTRRACGKLAVAGDLIAADAAAGEPGRPEIADVIFRSGVPSCAVPAAWLDETLIRYPGCAVAAVGLGGGECMVAVRGACQAFVLSVLAESGDSYRDLACAAFVYGWLAAGWPLAALSSFRLEVASSVIAAGWRMVRGPVAPLAFGVSYTSPPGSGSSGGPDSGSSCLTCSASGAPSSS
jgi:hypothetical protein